MRFRWLVVFVLGGFLLGSALEARPADGIPGTFLAKAKKKKKKAAGKKKKKQDEKKPIIEEPPELETDPVPPEVYYPPEEEPGKEPVGKPKEPVAPKEPPEEKPVRLELEPAPEKAGPAIEPEEKPAAKPEVKPVEQPGEKPGERPVEPPPPEEKPPADADTREESPAGTAEPAPGTSVPGTADTTEPEPSPAPGALFTLQASGGILLPRYRKIHAAGSLEFGLSLEELLGWNWLHAFVELDGFWGENQLGSVSYIMFDALLGLKARFPVWRLRLVAGIGFGFRWMLITKSTLERALQPSLGFGPSGTVGVEVPITDLIAVFVKADGRLMSDPLTEQFQISSVFTGGIGFTF